MTLARPAAGVRSARSSGSSPNVTSRPRLGLRAGLDEWQQHLADGLTAMRTRGELNADAEPARLATATMASIQGGLLLSQVRRDPEQMRVALDAAMIALRDAATT